MAEPTTAAGRRLLAQSGPGPYTQDLMKRSIAAIEAEARAAVLAELAAAVERLIGGVDEPTRAAVLAIICKEAPHD